MTPTEQLRAVVFDVGETLVDETGMWSRWADHLGVPRKSFLAALEAHVAARRHHREVFEEFRPGFDVAAAVEARIAAGDEPGFRSEDVFADARPCIARLRAAGLRVGIVGNTSVRTEAFLRATFDVDLIASAQGWGVEKPDPAFFARIAALLALPAGAIAYVGDRIDNDVLPAAAAGMSAVFLARGFWGRAHAGWPEAQRIALSIDGLDALPAALGLRG